MTVHTRRDGRQAAEIRPLVFTPGYLRSQSSSVLVEMGNTRVLCVTSWETKAQRWMDPQNPRPWISAEYNMLPGSSRQRIKRERQGASGRTQEIQRLIGRSLRTAIPLAEARPVSFTVDCDVLEADGGTRTAAINGAFLSLSLFLRERHAAGEWPTPSEFPPLAALSLGVVDGRVLVDLDYSEDSRAEVDMNIVARPGPEFIELQGTGERQSFSTARLGEMLEVVRPGLESIWRAGAQILNP